MSRYIHALGGGWWGEQEHILTQPIVEVILQIPIPQLHCLQDDIRITRKEVSIEVGGHRYQVKLLHTPDLQARLLPCLEELGVLHHHGAGLQRDRAEPEQGCGSQQGETPGRERAGSSTRSDSLEPPALLWWRRSSPFLGVEHTNPQLG